ncbi:HAD family phosphatase [Corynebacteriaceae bacterium 7-707]
MKGVIFDLDGTLIDSESLWARAEAEVAAAGGVLWTEADAFSCFGRPLAVTAQAIVDKGLDAGVDDVVDRLIDTMATLYRAGVPWIPGARELLEDLVRAGQRTALGTQSFRSLAELVKAEAPAGSLEQLVTGDELTNGKPDPEVFLAATERLGLSPEDVVVVEDSPTGVSAALAAEIPVVAVPATEQVYEDVRALGKVSTVPDIRTLTPALLAAVRGGEQINMRPGPR